MKLSKIFEEAGHPFLGRIDSLTSTQVPRPYQIDDLSKILVWDRAANYSEVGTGKSLTAFLYVIHKLLDGKKVVVVMPPTLIPQFMYEFTHIIRGHNFKFQNLSLPKKKREELLEEWVQFPPSMADVVFLSYNLFVKSWEILQGLGFTVLVADESHMACNPKTKSFKAIKWFMECITKPNFLSMSGTPTPTELRSAYGHIILKDPGKYASLSAFDREHVVWHEFTDFPKIVGYKNIKVLEENLNHHAIRHRSSEVLSLEAPNVMEQRVFLSPAHRALYKKLLRELIIEMGDEIIDGTNPAKLRVLALQLITGVQTYSETKIEDAPADMLKIVQESVGEGKLLVFVHFRSTVVQLAEVYKHLNPALMYGGSNVPKNVDKFNNDPTCKIAFLNYKSGGAGLNLQYKCHNTVFYESTGSPAEYQQAVGRTHRSGQQNVCNVWVFRYVNTISERLIDSALHRSKDIKAVMRDKKSILDALGV